MLSKTHHRNEWLRAAATFSGIALASAFSLDTMLTSGWQFDPPASHVRTVEASPSHASITDGGWRPDYSYNAVSWTDQMPIDEGYNAAPVERLDGAVDSADQNYSTAYYNVPTEEQLYQEIAALYAEQDARAEATPVPLEPVDTTQAPYVDADRYHVASAEISVPPVAKPLEADVSVSESE